jgi:hypothetical protein
VHNDCVFAAGFADQAHKACGGFVVAHVRHFLFRRYQLAYIRRVNKQRAGYYRKCGYIYIVPVYIGDDCQVQVARLKSAGAGYGMAIPAA